MFSMASAKSPEENKAAGLAFLEKNAKNANIVTTASGLQYEVLNKGTGTKSPAATDYVTVHYRGTSIEGKEFDSSYSRGMPATFPLNGVIAGWTEGVQLMTEGAKFRFYIPSQLAYGERGAGADIGPNETLIFDVELIRIQQL
ncbi:FKBP-type peptidyl-prolyl cis-trans isomerase [Methylosoma difficile]